ncbi:mechanosensitive ion channel domain-containing protein [Paraliomyxa miuraensis]|uniref:mechanosensitive ion channel domain-containing protein n=1 Tax=Paraliomyxa miuraensis TaxID=376150 RepID=UPI00225A38A0|nr:mechanosensitive ion channel domain-containing protein [Paraliomyxa miuraensis]MCX4241623.1 mechanosensitive ion channel family protein [Paraliomyxa miuraensis]
MKTKLLAVLRDNELARDGLVFLLLVVVVLVLRSAVLRAIGRSKLDVDDQLRWRTQVRNIAIIVLGLGAVVVWAKELHTAAISVAAVAAALVLATKEFIMCLMGSTLRASGGGFRVGDRIEVAGVRGDVLDIGPLTTAVLEVGPGQSIHQRTGRKITLPNSVFLTHPVTNETMSDEFVLHVLRVPLTADADWRTARDKLASIATERCARYVDDARRALAKASPGGVKTHLISTEPAVYLEVPEPNRVELLLRFPAPARQRGRVAQQILRRFLDDPAVDDDEPSDGPPPVSGSHA